MAAAGAGDSHEGTDSLVRQALDRLARGDASAKNELFALVRRQFERMARKLLRWNTSYDGLRRWEQTDDVVQQLSTRMLRALDTQSLTTPRDFFKLAATNLHWELKALREHHQAAKRSGRLLETNTEHDPKGGPPMVGRKLAEAAARPDWDETMARYLDAIEGVSADDREMLDLVILNGLTQEEAAATIEMPLSTFKRHYGDARLRLARRIREQGGP